jgi:addiction module HigA family antidote
MKTKMLPLLTPSEMLREEFLKPMGITAYRLAKDLRVPLTRISAILAGKRAITADTGLRLDRYFGLSEGWWFRLETECELRRAKRELSPALRAKSGPGNPSPLESLQSRFRPGEAEQWSSGAIHGETAEHPAAFRRIVAHVVIEAEAAELRLDIGVALRGDGFEDHIHVVSRARRRKRRIVQQQIHDGPSDKGVVHAETVKAVGDRAHCGDIRLRHGFSGDD